MQQLQCLNQQFGTRKKWFLFAETFIFLLSNGLINMMRQLFNLALIKPRQRKGWQEYSNKSSNERVLKREYHLHVDHAAVYT